MPKIILSLILVILSAGLFSLQAQTTVGETDFEVSLDYARFRGEQNLTLVEIYYAFHRDSVQHLYDGGGYIATYQTKLAISVRDSVIRTINWNGQDMVNSLDDIHPDQTINDVYGLLLGPGEFKVRLEIIDLANNNVGFNEIVFLVEAQKIDSLWMSDIQVGLQISRSKSQNRFVKNGISIIPNPSAIYSLKWPVLYYYYEIYNLKNPASADDAKYNIIASIRDIKGNIIKKVPAKSKIINNPSVVEIDKTLVSALRSGVYDLTIEIVNIVTNETASQEKQFFVYRAADYAQAEAQPQKKPADLYLVMLTKSEQELDREFEYTAYMASSDEEDMYEELDLEGKRKFLVSYWGLKNKIPELSTEAYRAGYLDRVTLANDRYSQGSTEGWETARGRILLLYGIPDDLEKQYGGTGSKQYETWTYHGLEGGSYFIFLDLSGYGNYQLVHSTVSTEINDMNWQENYLR